MNELSRIKLNNLINDTRTVVNSMTNRRRTKVGKISKSKISRVTNHRIVFEAIKETDEKAASLALELIESVEMFALSYNARLDFAEVEKMGAKIAEIIAEIEGLSGNV